MRTSSVALLLQVMFITSFQCKEFLGISNVFIDSQQKTISFTLEETNLTYPLNEYGLPSTTVLNILIDSILKVGLQAVDSNIPIPDIHEKATRKIGFIKVKATFTAQEGYVADVKTMVRKGDTALEREGDSVKLTVILGFQNLTVFFDKYKIEMLKLHFQGKLSAVIEDNAFQLDVELKKNKDECKVVLNSFKLITFNRIKVTITGAGPRWLTGKILTWVVNHFRKEIKKKIERRVSTVIGKIVSDEQGKICDLLKGEGRH